MQEQCCQPDWISLQDPAWTGCKPDPSIADPVWAGFNKFSLAQIQLGLVVTGFLYRRTSLNWLYSVFSGPDPAWTCCNWIPLSQNQSELIVISSLSPRSSLEWFYQGRFLIIIDDQIQSTCVEKCGSPYLAGYYRIQPVCSGILSSGRSGSDLIKRVEDSSVFSIQHGFVTRWYWSEPVSSSSCRIKTHPAYKLDWIGCSAFFTLLKSSWNMSDCHEQDY